jgi:hypothetical protein
MNEPQHSGEVMLPDTLATSALVGGRRLVSSHGGFFLLHH